MKQPSVYLKMRVLGAIDTVQGKTRDQRIKNVAAMTFLDEEGHSRQFTWRTIQTWHYRYKNHGIIATVARTLHTYTNTVKILCDAFRIEFDHSAFQCERRLIEQAFNLNHAGKTLTTILDDAHLMDLGNLRKLRLLFEDFPKNHNLVLIGRPSLLANLDLGVNHDIKSRVTYSVITKRLGPDAMRDFILRELDRVGLGHNTFTQPAVDLIVRSADGVLRKARNLCVGCMIEAVRAANKTIDIDNVNRVLMQPHWQKDADFGDF